MQKSSVETPKKSNGFPKSPLVPNSEDSFDLSSDSQTFPRVSLIKTPPYVPPFQDDSPENYRSHCIRLRYENNVLMDNLKHERMRSEHFESRFNKQWERTAELDKMVIELRSQTGWKKEKQGTKAKLKRKCPF